MSEQDGYPLVGSAVVQAPLPGKSDFSDWLDLMETVEALCPMWPARPVQTGGKFRL
ncbi:MAG: hypothetical protein L0H19_01785 [Salinisphaera sp.]|nr:hypothetical protein [Salinisphaera sp.]MDN5937664.1 hypothetical protein [Salinisphaera sp.]